MALIDQPCAEGVGGQMGTTYEYVLFLRFFESFNGFGIEISFEMRFARGDGRQGFGIHDFVGGLPNLRKVARDRGAGNQVEVGFPTLHYLIHPSSVEMRTGRAFEVIDESMHFLIWRCPVKPAVCVFDVTVE